MTEKKALATDAVEGSGAVEDAAAEEFDVDAWISGARLPERTVPIYGRPDLRAEYEELDAQLTDARRAAEEGQGDVRLTGRSPERRIAERMADVRKEMEASRRLFRLRGLTKEKIKAIYAAAPGGPKNADVDYVASHWVAEAAVVPSLTAEQAERMRAAIGEGQFSALWDACQATSSERRVSVPFSAAASAALSTQES